LAEVNPDLKAEKYMKRTKRRELLRPGEKSSQIASLRNRQRIDMN
jgi:hypothetical protein